MCVSLDLAEFSGTVLYGGRRRHPRYGPIEVLGYQNTATNRATGPNAMLLHLPARRLDQRHFVPVGPHAGVLTSMLDAVRPLPVNDGIDWMGEPDEVEVFEHDVYTVVLAADPTLITDALSRVPRHKRPRVDPALLAFYREAFPGHAFAFCCFDNARAERAKPLLIWYEPVDPERIVLPALDCHTGAVPDLDAWVSPDHWLLFGSDDADPEWGEPVEYAPDLDPELGAFLPDRVMGVAYRGTALPNGDFAIGHADLLRGELARVTRLVPQPRRPGR
ncbi:hypothetical protein AB0J86_29580 [Micromonospora sp. NPDC049559]|uniref:hypothetical protein n=1 Tax=Micromonospora sp. NPDC049559 TaxID=3155923 RepID=UPI00343AF427